MSLPALPIFVTALHATPGQAQLTLSLYMIGFAAGQLVLGPASDRFGRRPVMLAGLLVYSIAGAACAASVSIEQLIAFRFLQGTGASIGAVIVRAIIRDYYGRRAGTSALAGVLTVQATAPLVAPVIGSFLVVTAGWHSIFVTLALTGVAMWIAAYIAIPESLANPDERAMVPRRFLANAGRFYANRTCLGYSLIAAASSGVLFSYLAGSPFVLTQVFGVPTQIYGFLLAGNAIVVMIANQANIAALRRVQPEPLLRFGLILAAGAVIALAFVTHGRGLVLGAFLACTYTYFFAHTFIFPNAIAAALDPVPEIAGVGSSLLGTGQMIAASIAAYFVGRLYDHTPSSLVLCMGLAVLCMLLAYGSVLLTTRKAAHDRH